MFCSLVPISLFSMKSLPAKRHFHSYWLSLSVLDCPAGFYGAECTEKCACVHMEPCHPVTGTCQCDPGFFGARCAKGDNYLLTKAILGWAKFSVAFHLYGNKLIKIGHPCFKEVWPGTDKNSWNLLRCFELQQKAKPVLNQRLPTIKKVTNVSCLHSVPIRVLRSGM